mmetsp:Transcript_5173/g.18074  ORF Transcript_5173/g.18074 Transcript_5173/m.18074 type:complete len:318 (+) Transcript_5173:16-969(+)
MITQRSSRVQQARAPWPRAASLSAVWRSPRFRASAHAFSMTAAAPIPEPMHMDTTPTLASGRRFISCSSVATHLAPVAPRGWPRAMAPPLGFTLLASSPSLLTQYVACEAKASLSSYRSTSFGVSPAALVAAGIATAGPMPMIAGSQPTAAKERHTPMMGRRLFVASDRFMSSTAPAPSVICDALPGVVDPPFLNTAGSLARISGVMPSRMPSSSSRVTVCSSPVFLSLTLVVTGTISSRKRPAARAAAARACDRAAISSCCSRVTPNLAATFSEVTPMGIMQFCASLDSPSRGFAPPSHAMGLVVMVSTPAPMPMV